MNIQLINAITKEQTDGGFIFTGYIEGYKDMGKITSSSMPILLDRLKTLFTKNINESDTPIFDIFTIDNNKTYISQSNFIVLSDVCLNLQTEQILHELIRYNVSTLENIKENILLKSKTNMSFLVYSIDEIIEAKNEEQEEKLFTSVDIVHIYYRDYDKSLEVETQDEDTFILNVIVENEEHAKEIVSDIKDDFLGFNEDGELIELVQDLWVEGE